MLDRRLRAGGACLAAAPALVAVALDLTRELSGALPDGMGQLARCELGTEGRALEIERHLRDLVLGDRGVALLAQLDLHPRQVGDLGGDLAELALHELA